MAAAHAVLNTVELLENIIIYLPAHQIHPLKRLSTFWNELIRTSLQVRNARSLFPIKHFPEDGVPIYESEATIRLHHALCPPGPFKHVVKYTSSQTVLTKLTLAPPVMHTLKRYRDLYLTNPRCEVLQVTCYGFYGRERNECVVYVRGGIKIKDLLEVWKGLQLVNRELLGSRNTSERVFIHQVPESEALGIQVKFAHSR